MFHLKNSATAAGNSIIAANFSIKAVLIEEKFLSVTKEQRRKEEESWTKLIIVKGKLRVAGVKLRLAGKRHRGILLSVQSSECLEFRVFIDYVTNCENLPSQESIVHQTYDLKKCECFKFKAITNGTQ